jgi:Mg2+ and Co2+ transporter CorA
MYEGAIIKETLTDELILDDLKIERVEIWKTDETIKYWTMIFFKSDVRDFPEKLSKAIIDGWFADMKAVNVKFIVFKNTVLKYEIGNPAEKAQVLDECRARGIPEEQLNWSE